MNELGNSRKVVSNQVGLNEQLETVVRKHLTTDFQKPYQEHTLTAFNALAQQLAGDSRPIIFDSCCGVGESTVKIAQMHPDAVVIGLDKSAHRLAKTPISLPDNAVLLQVDLNDFWRLAVEAGWQLSHHYLLYPNPWPKAKHFQRRWHGSSVFPYILKLGGKLEVRSNWQTYVDEFAASLGIAGFETKVEQYQSEEAITPFERKYWASGQDSWRLQLHL
ncbi:MULTISPECIES: SAM-dependent methyltransferase [unclassified Motilimonas]|uniref:tRNA (guanine(46)-N(7))-methyltransferase TrmB n=1 Tax=Motilimonas TaxID=1914248 RepID=UPI001E4632B6|nr:MULTISPECIES: SAM-dependent methyltransferase [unclassified Motilimonas]MCE0558685.1 SAM-dependent methyltransferase [Motilimonas sp. E26]MDO6525715.1 SAM-dependent methyltransferase [Motilimonas sp. 1_MG-2023]